MSIFPQRTGGQIVLFVVFYCFLMYALLTLGRAAGVSSVIWPTNALALGIYMLFRRSDFLPFTFVVIGGAFIVHLLLGDTLSYSIACAIGSGLTFGLVGWGCTHFGMASSRTLSVRMVIGLAGVAIFATIPGAFVGAVTLTATTGGDVGQYFMRWWLPEMASIVLLLPPFALWRNADDWPGPEEIPHGTQPSPLHRANLGETVVASAVLAASGGIAILVGDPLMLNLGAVALLWFAFRLGVFQTAAAASLFSVAMVIGTSVGTWHFGEDRLVGLLRLQGVMALDVLPALFVAAVIAQRERLRRKLHQDERRLSFALEAANDGIWDLHVPTGSLFLSPQAHRMLGYGPGEIKPKLSDVHEMIHCEDLHNCARGFLENESAHTDSYEREFRIRHKTGTWIWLHERGKVVERDAEHKAIRVVGTVTDVTRRKQLEEELAHAAAHDRLTGVANRAAFDDALSVAQSRWEHYGEDFALMLIDLDHFKSVNDTHGHAAGDALLSATAAFLREATRTGDLVARFGGDEFAVIAFERDRAEIAGLARHICATLSRPVTGPAGLLTSSVSLGIAMAGDGSTATHLLRQADEALYEAKRAGRRTWRIFEAIPQKQTA